MDSETFLEVLGPDLGIQDLLSHGAGEPASLLVVQTLAKDPPCVGTGWEGQAVGVRLRAEPPSQPGLSSVRGGEVREVQEPSRPFQRAPARRTTAGHAQIGFSPTSCGSTALTPSWGTWSWGATVCPKYIDWNPFLSPQQLSAAQHEARRPQGSPQKGEVTKLTTWCLEYRHHPLVGQPVSEPQPRDVCFCTWGSDTPT